MADDVFGIGGSVQAGSFRVDRVVAEGGFAVVYCAHHGGFRANVALKCLKVPGQMSQEDQATFLEAFREEAELLFHLSATIPTVVRPLHVGTLNQPAKGFVPFIALEWLEGRTLDELIRLRLESGKGPLNLGEAIHVLTPVANALERAHKFPMKDGKIVSIIHRDMKPENIFLAEVNGLTLPKILDFGIATVKTAATTAVGKQSVEGSGLSAFTPAYGAPEQWLPKRFGQTGSWTDVWGLAITLIECVLGRSPLAADDTAAMMGAAIDPTRRPTPRSEGLMVSDDVEAVFEQALALDPKDRFHAVAAFWSALGAAIGDDTVSAAVSAEPTADSVLMEANAATMRAESVQKVSIKPEAVPDLVIGSRAEEAPKKQAPAPAAIRKEAPARPQSSKRRPKSRKKARKSQEAPADYLVGKTIGGFDEDDAADFGSLALDTDDDLSMSGGVMSSGSPLSGPGPVSSGGAEHPAAAMHAGPHSGERGREARDRRIQQGNVAINQVKASVKMPVRLVIGGVGIMVADFIYAQSAGAGLQMGPVRALWVAGPLVVVGIVLVVTRLIQGLD